MTAAFSGVDPKSCYFKRAQILTWILWGACTCICTGSHHTSARTWLCKLCDLWSWVLYWQTLLKPGSKWSFLFRYDCVGTLVPGNDRPRLWSSPGLRPCPPWPSQRENLPSAIYIWSTCQQFLWRWAAAAPLRRRKRKGKEIGGWSWFSSPGWLLTCNISMMNLRFS